MGMNETSTLAEPVKSAKERLDDLLAKVEQVKKEVQAEEEAKKVPPKIEIEVWSTIGGYLSDPHRAWYVKPFELAYKKSGASRWRMRFRTTASGTTRIAGSAGSSITT